MNHKNQKRISFILIFIVLLSFPVFPVHSDTYIGEIEKGLIELKDFTYPVYIFIPPTIQPERKYPLILAIPDPGETPEKHIELWTGIAKRQTMIVLVPTYKRIQDVPYSFDRWFFQMKSLIETKYPINPSKIYLVGKEGGADYAAYLGVNFPDEFSAVGLLGGSWAGNFKQLLRIQSEPDGQIPFFVALKEDQKELYQETEPLAYEFSQKGYPVRLVQFQKGEEFLNSDFKKEMFKWLEDQSEKWELIVSKSQKTFKQKARRAIKNFFVV